MQLVNADDGHGVAVGQLATGNEVLGFLHHHAHLLQVIGCDAAEAAGVHDEPCRLGADARHTEYALIVVAVDIDWELLRVTQSPR